MRVAWFSPMPPVRSGIAGRSAELIGALRGRGVQIDVYVDEPVARAAVGVRSAHDFVWRHARQPYDLTLFQFGNSSHHDYEWPYALRYPGLIVLHDTHLHHARAAALLREDRPDDYRAEFAWNHPNLNRDLAEAAVAGLDSALYYSWPMVRALVTRARLTAVHGDGARGDLLDALPEVASSNVVSIRLGEGETLTTAREAAARARVRALYGIAPDAVVFGCSGSLTPEKRITQILDAMRATLPYAPSARLLLAGAPAAHYDAAADVRLHGLSDVAVLTGYLASDTDVADHLAACDVSLNLRWPTARETSGPWLRALAAARPTVIMDLAHTGNVPSLDPRTWEPRVTRAADAARYGATDPICIAIDVLDEDHSLRLAMRRLSKDPALRAQLGSAARAWWTRTHSVDLMVDDYMRVMELACQRIGPDPGLPSHLLDKGDSTLRALLQPFDLAPSRVPFE